MKHPSKSHQAGLSFFGLIFVIALLVSVGVLGMQAFPTFMEYQAVQKAVEKAKTGNTPGEIKATFDKAAQIDDIKSISGKDLDISKNSDKVLVKYAYNKEIHMFGPAFLLLKYAGQSK